MRKRWTKGREGPASRADTLEEQAKNGTRNLFACAPSPMPVFFRKNSPKPKRPFAGGGESDLKREQRHFASGDTLLLAPPNTCALAPPPRTESSHVLRAVYSANVPPRFAGPFDPSPGRRLQGDFLFACGERGVLDRTLVRFRATHQTKHAGRVRARTSGGDRPTVYPHPGITLLLLSLTEIDRFSVFSMRFGS